MIGGPSEDLESSVKKPSPTHLPLVHKSLHKKAGFFGIYSGLCNVMRYITIIPRN